MIDYTKYLLIPYKHRGRDYNGADCFGIARLFYKEELGIDLPDFTEEYPELWWNKAAYFLSKYKEYGFEFTQTPKYGDIIFFKNNKYTVGHCGILLEDGLFLHMVTSGAAITPYQRGVSSRNIYGYVTYTGKP